MRPSGKHELRGAEVLRPGDAPVELQLTTRGGANFFLDVTEAGRHVLFTQHHPDEFNARLSGPDGSPPLVASHVFNPEHEHDEAVTSVGIAESGSVNLEQLNRWFSTLLMEKGTDIFRMKGILSVQGEPRRFVFQGVHMLFDGRPTEPWKGDEARSSQLVFIGRNLDRTALVDGFRACLA